jgi:epsilon-lactone hydrolase
LLGGDFLHAGAGVRVEQHGQRRDGDRGLHADLSGLGPIYIHVGDQELFLDDSRMLAKHAQESRQHSFQMAAGLAPGADDAISRFAAWARPKLGVPSQRT